MILERLGEHWFPHTPSFRGGKTIVGKVMVGNEGGRAKRAQIICHYEITY